MDVSLLLANSEALLRACALDVEAEAFSQGLEVSLRHLVPHKQQAIKTANSSHPAPWTAGCFG
jgi:hypothetical protein